MDLVALLVVLAVIAVAIFFRRKPRPMAAQTEEYLADYYQNKKPRQFH